MTITHHLDEATIIALAAGTLGEAHGFAAATHVAYCPRCRAAFRDAVRLAFSEAASAGWRELWCCDETFADWPLNDAGVIASLVRWARPQRRLTLVARHFDDLAVCHPRWVAWRRTWSHVVVCRAVEPEMRLDVPTLLCAPPSCTLRLADRIRHFGVLTTDVHDTVAAREQIDAITQRSVETFGATTLGL